MRPDLELKATIVGKYSAVAPVLDERSRRVWAAAESAAIGYDGDALVSSATGLARETIRRGRRAIGRCERERNRLALILMQAAPPLFGPRAAVHPTLRRGERQRVVPVPPPGSRPSVAATDRAARSVGRRLGSAAAVAAHRPERSTGTGGMRAPGATASSTAIRYWTAACEWTASPSFWASVVARCGPREEPRQRPERARARRLDGPSRPIRPGRSSWASTSGLPRHSEGPCALGRILKALKGDTLAATLSATPHS